MTGIHPWFLDPKHSKAPMAPVKTAQESQRFTLDRQSLNSIRVVPAWTPKKTWKMVVNDPATNQTIED